jgi:hypothetical protein
MYRTPAGCWVPWWDKSKPWERKPPKTHQKERVLGLTKEEDSERKEEHDRICNIGLGEKWGKWEKWEKRTGFFFFGGIKKK